MADIGLITVILDYPCDRRDRDPGLGVYATALEDELLGGVS